MKTIDWISLPEKSMTTSKTVEENGVKIHYETSPWNIPQAFRYFVDSRKGHFVIEFDYLSNSEKKVSDEAHGVKWLIGKNSKRIYKLHVDLEKLSAAAQKQIENNEKTSPIIALKESIQKLLDNLGKLENNSNEQNIEALKRYNELIRSEKQSSPIFG